VDCLPGLVCTSASGNGLCVLPPFIPGTECAVAGSHCGDPGDPTCCGVCKGSSCVVLADAPCSRLTGAPCQAQTECCIDLRCVFDAGIGACQPTCGTERAPCDPRRGNADCCLDYGFTCMGWGIDGGAPFACNDLSAVPPDAGCVAACTDGGPPQCQLGAPCNPNTTAENDNCTAAGLYCSELSSTCAVPADGVYCIEGGAPCRDGPDREIYGQYLQNAEVSMECIQPEGIDAPVCDQLCESTADCASPYDSCCLDCVPKSCGFGLNTCSDVYGRCDAEGTADGRCESFAPFGNLCVQANVDGGGPGSACDELATRENPAFCDYADQCWFGVCVPVCSASGNPACPSGSQFCIPSVPDSPYGACLTFCELWTSGGCPAVDGGTAQVCLPYFLPPTSGDSVDVCVGQQANPLPVGAACIPPTGPEIVVSYPSPCVAGAICLNEVGSNDWTCRQLCALRGGGSPPCPPDSTCHPIPVAPSISATDLGVCSPSTPLDGG
jgi:hypothetical protein